MSGGSAISHSEIKQGKSIDCKAAVDIDEVLEWSGPCGRFNCLYQLFFITFMLAIGFHTTMVYFTGHNPPWKCSLNSSVGDTFCTNNFNMSFSSDNPLFTRRCELTRDDWTYTTASNYSFVTNFELVCGKAWMAALANGAFFVGGIFGCFPAGTIADKYGRKITLFIFLSLTISGSIACSYASNIWQLVSFRALIGAGEMPCISIGFVTLSELMPPSYRTLSGNLYQATFTSSQLLITLAAYLDRKWRHIQLYVSFLALVPLILLYFLPNSPRWLLSVGRRSDAETTLKEISACNGVPLKMFRLKLKNDNDDHNYTYLHLFTNRSVLILTFTQLFIWWTVSLVYYTIAFASSDLGGNMYQSFALSAIADLPCYVLSTYLLHRLGRKKTILGSIYISSVLVAIMATVPTSYSHKYIVNMTLSMLAKGFTNIAFSSMFVWTCEIYPTVLRSQGFSLCIVSQRIGAFVAPFLIGVLKRISFVLPFIVICVACVACATFGLLLPETIRQPTREGYEDFFRDAIQNSKRVTPTMGLDNAGSELSNTTSTRNVVDTIM